MTWTFGTLAAYSGRIPLDLKIEPTKERDQAAIDAERLQRKQDQVVLREGINK
jgi:hypothetical protein